MTLTQVHALPNGVTVGFDDNVNDWVRVDPQALEGSALGNIGRSALRAMQEINLGADQASGKGGPDIQQRIEALRQQQAAASVAAPYASAIGNAVPDTVAGLALAGATGGLGIPAMLAAEGGLGFGLGAIRPGSVEERATSGAVYALMSVGGAGVGLAAAKGLTAAVRAFSGLEGKGLARIAGSVDEAASRKAAAEAALQADAAGPGTAAPGSAAEPGSVGAARTPAGATGAQAQLESEALAAGDATGADLMDLPRMQQMAQRAQELDMPVPLGFGSRAMSPARLTQSVGELMPGGDYFAKRIMNQQKARTSELLSEAIGLKPKPALFIDDLADAEAEIGTKFERVRTALPNVDGEAIAKALESVGNAESGAFGSFKGQQAIAKAIENARQRPVFTGAEFMNTRRTANALMSDAFKSGDTASGEVLMSAVNKLDDLAEKALKRAGKEKTAELWSTARTQWRISEMTKIPGVVNVGTGEVNPLSLFNKMRKNPSSGGWGRARPPAGTPARKLYDALEIGVASQSQVPMTGARGLIRDAMNSTVGKTIAGGAGVASIWDALRGN